MKESFGTEEAVYRLCPACAYLKPCVRDLDLLARNIEIYQDRYDENLEVMSQVTAKVARKYRRFLDRCEPYRGTGRLLDVGCGAGRLLACAAERGWEAVGCDPSMKKASSSTPPGVTIHPRLLDACAFEDGHFDVVHANEVVEHVEEVLPLVAEMCRVLRPGGVLILRTPNHASWTTAGVGARWRHFGVARHGHVGFFAPKTLDKLFRQAGLEPLRIETRQFSLRDRWSDKTPVLGPILKIAYKIVAQAAILAKAGDRLTGWARKPER